MLSAGITNGFAAAKQAKCKFGMAASLTRGLSLQQRMYMTMLQRSQVRNSLAFAQAAGVRRFSDAVVAQQEEEDGEIDMADANARFGADQEFSKQKHAYVLTFPWNFDEIIDEFQAKYRPLADNQYWSLFVRNSGAIAEFNVLFREFH